MAAATVVGEALQAGLGLLLSDPSMTGQAVQHVLPVAITYDLLCSPFVLLLVSAVRPDPQPGSAGFAAISVVLAPRRRSPAPGPPSASLAPPSMPGRAVA